MRHYMFAGIILTVGLLTACNGAAPNSTTEPARSESKVVGNEETGPVQRIYAKTSAFALFAGKHPGIEGDFADGKLWVEDLKTGEIKQLKDAAQFGEQSFIMGAVLSPQEPVAYALLSAPDEKVGQREYIVKVDLSSGIHSILAEDLDLKVIDIDGQSLAISPQGDRLAFQASSAAEGEDRAVGVYEIQLSRSGAPLNAQSLQTSVTRATLDKNRGLMPEYSEDGRLQFKPVDLTVTRAVDTRLASQAVSYGLRLPLSGDGFYVQRGYFGAPTHTSTYNDEYALDFAREPRNLANGQCVGYDIYAAATGLAVRVRTDGSPGGGFGNYVELHHTINGQNVKTIYAHLQQLPNFVENQTTVTRNQYIQEMGNTGNTGGFCHLHFSYRTNPGNVSLRPATAAAPMQGLGPYSAGAASGSCPITSFDNANTTTFYRFYNC